MKIRIYAEGGGSDANSRGFLRQALNEFFRDLREIARKQRHSWDIVCCGGRDAAFDQFCTALKNHSDSLVVLLVDSEGPLVGQRWVHLSRRDGWKRPSHVADIQAQLMVQAMEAWIIADRVALSKYYGQGFLVSRLPALANVESRTPAQLLASLVGASAPTQKREYGKIKHAVDLLKRIDPTVVKANLPSCRQLFKELAETLEQSQ